MARKKMTPLPVLKKVADGTTLRDLQAGESVGEGSVLPNPQPADAPADAKDRIFTVSPEPAESTPANVGTGNLADAELNLDLLLKQILLEEAAEEFQEEGSNTRMKGIEILARGLIDDALRGDKNTRALVIERIGGKAVRAAQVQPPDTTLEDQLDRASVEALNSLVEKKDDSP